MNWRVAVETVEGPHEPPNRLKREMGIDVTVLQGAELVWEAEAPHAFQALIDAGVLLGKTSIKLTDVTALAVTQVTPHG